MSLRPIGELPYLEWLDGAVVRRVYADSWESEDLSLPSAITKNAVEAGSRITDHWRLEPIPFSCRMFFSECPIRGDLDTAHVGRMTTRNLSIAAYPKLTPLLSPAGLTGVVREGISAVGEKLGLISAAPWPPSASVLTFDAPPGRMREFLELLIELREKRTLMAIGSTVLRIESMGLENARIARSSEDGDSGAFDLTFSQLEFVSSETAEALPLPLEPRGQSKKGVDGKGASDVDPNTAQGSAAKKALDAAGITSAGSGV